MKDMKLIMESWRRFTKKVDSPIFIFENNEIVFYNLNEKLDILAESNNAKEIELLFEKWLGQAETILNENLVTDFFAKVKDKVSDLAGSAKAAVLRFLKDPYSEMALQLWMFLSKIKSEANLLALLAGNAFRRVVNILAKINEARIGFKQENPLTYALISTVVKIAIVMVAYYFVEQLAGSGVAQAKISGLPGGAPDLTGDSATTEAVVGLLKSNGHPEMAKEVARMAASPENYDFGSLAPKMQSLITDSIDKIADIMSQVKRYSTPGAETIKQEYIDKLESLRQGGTDILQNLASSAEKLGSDASQANQYITGNPKLASLNYLLDISKKLSELSPQGDNMDALMQAVKKMVGDQTVPDEIKRATMEAVRNTDGEALRKIMQSLKS